MHSNPPPPPTASLSQEYGVLDTAFLLNEFKEKRWMILRSMVTLSILALVFTFKPHYPTVKTTLRIDPPAGRAVGISALHNVDTELGSIKSHGMVSEALERASYYALVTPISVKEAASKDRPLGDKPGAIHFHQLYFPPAMEGREWRINILEDGRYTLSTKGGEVIAEAGVGDVITGTAEQSGSNEQPGRYRIEVEAIEALPGSSFSVKPKRASALVGMVLQELDVTKRNSAPGSNLIDIELTLPDVTLAYHLVAYISENYILQSLDRQSSAQRQAIRKLESTINELKTEVDEGKKALLDFYDQHHATDPALELQNLIPQRSQLEADLQEALVKQSQLELVYTPRHPAMNAVQQEVDLLSRQLKQVTTAIASLPQQQRTLDQLERQLSISTDLYQTAIKELARVQLETNSLPQTVHLIDAPRVTAPSRIKYIIQLMVFGGMLGLISALALVLLSASVRLGRLHALSQLNGLTRLPVNQAILKLQNGTLETDSAARLEQLATFSYHQTGRQWMALCSPKSGSEAAELTLRFAAALGRDRKVLLVDACLYDSPLAPLLGGEGRAGLVELLTNRAALPSLVQSTSYTGVSFLPAGRELVNYELLRSGEALHGALEASDAHTILVCLPPPQVLPNNEALLERFDRIIHWVRTGTTLESIRHYLNFYELPAMPAQAIFVYASQVMKKQKTRNAPPPRAPKAPRTAKPARGKPAASGRVFVD